MPIHERPHIKSEQEAKCEKKKSETRASVETTKIIYEESCVIINSLAHALYYLLTKPKLTRSKLSVPCDVESPSTRGDGASYWGETGIDGPHTSTYTLPAHPRLSWWLMVSVTSTLQSIVGFGCLCRSEPGRGYSAEAGMRHDRGVNMPFNGWQWYQPLSLSTGNLVYSGRGAAGLCIGAVVVLTGMCPAKVSMAKFWLKGLKSNANDVHAANRSGVTHG
ncbi:hypothetical protein PR048_008764 [Dryococelus australis]|uniref:Uncharacterized protein n=1 Tax=Dryococelus australis TaxID=614101 RepID=A0ABQ9HYV9_9NEOP|nr:hypothetical protein PR048_008764 [Dryococelus australis]